MSRVLIHNLHGDLGLHPVDGREPPATATYACMHVLQASSVTGNRHEVACADAKIARWAVDGREYVHCDVDYVIRHMGGDAEHGEQVVQAGVREVRHEVEYDPWKHELRIVMD